MKFLNKKTIGLLLCGLLAVMSFSGIMAYYVSTTEFRNEFNTGNPQIRIVEEFNPHDDWVPGEKKEKVVEFGNSGTMDMLMRFKVETTVKDAQGQDQTNEQTALDGTTKFNLFELAWENPTTADAYDFLNGPSEAEYIKIGDYYYYNKILKAGTTTNPTLKFVEFSDYAGNKYQGWSVNVVVTCEMYQFDKQHNGSQMIADWATVATFTGESGKETVSWTVVSTKSGN